MLAFTFCIRFVSCYTFATRICVGLFVTNLYLFVLGLPLALFVVLPNFCICSSCDILLTFGSFNIFSLKQIVQ